MSRGPQTFRQRDLLKAIKVAQAAGLPIGEIKVDKTGARIVLGSATGKPTSELTPYDRWKASRADKA